MTDQATPKPCPFCQSACVADTTPPQATDDYSAFWVCPDCAASGPGGRSTEEATTAWNTRPDFDALKAVAEEMEGQLSDVLKHTAKCKHGFGLGFYEVCQVDDFSEHRALVVERDQLKEDNLHQYSALTRDIRKARQRAEDAEAEVGKLEHLIMEGTESALIAWRRKHFAEHSVTNEKDT